MQSGLRHRAQAAALGALVAGSTLAPLPARAWGSLLLMEAPGAQATWAAGPSIWSLPAYPGARATRATVLPGFDYYAPSGLFVSTDLAVGWNLSKRPDVQAGVRLWPQFGRRASDSPQGVPSIGTRIQAEAFYNRMVLPELLLQSGLSHGAGRRHDGTQLEIGATSGLPIAGDLLGIGLAATYANRAFRESYFGVSAQQAASSGLAPYAVANGWQDISLTLSSEHRFGAQWRLDGQMVVAHLLGSAARSPLARSRQQVGATLTLWREF